MKRRLLFGSSVAVLLLAISFAMAGTGMAEPRGSNDTTESASSESSVVSVTRTMSFTAPGRVAIFAVTPAGGGILSVDVADFNPTSYPDYWRVTIVVYRGTQAYIDRVSDQAATNVGYPGTGTGWGAYSGRTDMLVASPYTYLVLISYERGANTWTAGCNARFFYSGAAMVVSAAPRTGF